MLCLLNWPLAVSMWQISGSCTELVFDLAHIELGSKKYGNTQTRKGCLRECYTEHWPCSTQLAIAILDIIYQEHSCIYILQESWKCNALFTAIFCFLCWIPRFKLVDKHVTFSCSFVSPQTTELQENGKNACVECLSSTSLSFHRVKNCGMPCW